MRLMSLPLIPALLCFALFATGAKAENSQDFGDYVVHFNALTTDMLPPVVARQYEIVRSQHRGMLNVTVLRKVLGTPGEPVPAKVTCSASNLTGQTKQIALREIREGNAIYYIGEFPVANEETLNFNIQLQPEGVEQQFNVKFRDTFYTR